MRHARTAAVLISIGSVLSGTSAYASIFQEMQQFEFRTRPAESQFYGHPYKYDPDIYAKGNLLIELFYEPLGGDNREYLDQGVLYDFSMELFLPLTGQGEQFSKQTYSSGDLLRIGSQYVDLNQGPEVIETRRGWPATATWHLEQREIDWGTGQSPEGFILYTSLHFWPRERANFDNSFLISVEAVCLGRFYSGDTCGLDSLTGGTRTYYDAPWVECFDDAGCVTRYDSSGDVRAVPLPASLLLILGALATFMPISLASRQTGSVI